MSTLLRLLRLFRPYLWWALAGVALNMLVILANVGLLALSGWFIAAMALAGLGGSPIEYFAPAAAIRGLAILRTGGRYLERLVTHEATFRLLAELRVWFYARLEPLAPARLQYERGGDLLNRIRSDIDSLDNLYLRILAPTSAAVASGLLLTGFIALFSPQLALIEAAGLLAAGVVLPLLAQAAGRRSGRRAVALRAELRAALSDTVGGLAELLLEGAADRHAAAIATLSQALASEQRQQARLGAVSTAISGLAAQVALWSALIVAIPLVRAGSLSGPDLALLGLFVLASFEAVAPLPAAFAALGGTLAAARRIFAIADAAPAVPDPAREAPPPARFDITFRNVRLRYAEGAPPALDGLDLQIPEGGALGIIGASGSGKTSILNALLRFWPFEAGDIQIGGVSIRDLRGDTVRSLCSVVAQRTHLFNTSVRDNLLLARPGATDADLLDALRAASLYDEVVALPAGLDTLIGENGARLSGGQARRLAIARALLKDAPILLLDEPTEGLDAISERAVLDGLKRLMRGRTTLLITHRPQALGNVTRVIELDRGRQTASGNAQQLMGLQAELPERALQAELDR